MTSATELAVRLVERTPLPDSLTLAGIDALVKRSLRRLSAAGADDLTRFVADMTTRAVAEHADEAKQQHYELPPEFFVHTLGPRRKYSSCLYRSATATLAEAEDAALAETAVHADLHDGQSVLELGCGWGSLSLWMAASYPNSAITSVSNSRPQRLFIEGEAARLGLKNLTVLTEDMNEFTPTTRFDRVVSVEMFEHMTNWRALLGRVRDWLKPEGRLFLHVFSHPDFAYRFDPDDKSDWIAQHFFTGGIMPAHGLIRCFSDLFELEQDWRWSGTHYQRTALHWLENFDRNDALITPILRAVYGDDAALWRRRWRLFYLATAGLFGCRNGQEYGVSHYRLKPVR